MSNPTDAPDPNAPSEQAPAAPSPAPLQFEPGTGEANYRDWLLDERREKRPPFTPTRRVLLGRDGSCMVYINGEARHLEGGQVHEVPEDVAASLIADGRGTDADAEQAGADLVDTLAEVSKAGAFEPLMQKLRRKLRLNF